MRQRVITAVFFVLAMLLGVYGGQLAFFALFLLITAGCLWEFYGLTLPATEPGAPARRVLATLLATLPYVVFGGLMTDLFQFDFFRVPYLLGLLLLGFTVVLPLAELYWGARLPFAHLGHAFYGLGYITLPMVLLVLIYMPNEVGIPHRVMGLLLLTWTNDTFAYLIGRQIGRHKLFERISPNKTWEGTVGGGLCTVALAWGLSYLLPGAYTLPQWLALGAVAAVFATLGDLIESMLKRSLGIKDSGNLLPGHGGLLDRFDAFLLVVPVAWAVLGLF